MRLGSETWTMMPMNFFCLTICRTRIFATAAMLALAVVTFAPAPAHAADALVHTFGFGMGAGTSCSNNLDGADPKGSLTFANNFLFGRTSTTNGKGNGDGIVFHIDPNDPTTYKIDVQFAGAKTDGNDPRHNAMTLVGTVLFGTTLTGGKHDTGSIFSINDDGMGYSGPLFDFLAGGKKNTGDMPHSCFAENNGVLYGMTAEGGKKGAPTGNGTIFSFDPQTPAYTLLYSFDGKHGSDPHGQPILDPTGAILYGMTRTGGKHMVGVIFSFDLTTKKIKTLHNFSCPKNATPLCINKNDGATPDHGTLLLSGTTLYGLTTAGGSSALEQFFPTISARRNLR